MAKKDQSVMYLKDHGYSVVRLPRSDFQPSQTLIRAGKKDLQRSGELKDLMIMGANPLPSLSANNTAPLSISGKESSTIKIDIGLEILGGIISALGGIGLGPKVGFGNATNLVVKFENVTEDHIDINLLDQFLTTASLRTDQTGLNNALRDNRVYVVNSTIKTNEFGIKATADSNAEVSLDIPAISQVASGKLSVDVSKAREGVVSYKGTTPVVFGFQAVQLFFDPESGAYSSFEPMPAGSAAAKTLIEPNYLTLDEGVFFRIDEP